MLADLDSIVETKDAVQPKSLPNVRCREKTQAEWECDPGTVGQRASEVTSVSL